MQSQQEMEDTYKILEFKVSEGRLEGIVDNAFSLRSQTVLCPYVI